MKLPGKSPISTIRKKSPQIFGTQSIVNDLNIVAVDSKKLSETTNKTFSMRLKKWVEPYKISGVDYSLFYTEVDHNYKLGDRIFIEGGFYDSDNFILNNQYKKGVDGYKVLYVDKCKVVLNIPYTGQLPTNEEEIDNFVKIYVASTQYEFDYYCQVLSMRNDVGNVQNKFDLGFNNFLFLNGTFSITPGTYQLQSFASDFSLTSTSTTMGNSFIVRGNTSSNNYFVDITNDVLIDNIIPYLNIGYTQSLSGFYNNGKLRMMNGNFEIGDIKFKNEYIYYFDTNENKWKIDKTYLPTIITEQHFRRGILRSGIYNQGLFGQHEERISYNGDNIQWNLGSTLNVDWKSGILDSKIINNNSYFTVFDRYELPQIRANSSNNGGSGYNYIFNTNFTGGDLINGNIFNMAVVYGTNSTVTSVLENYLTGTSSNYSINIHGGVYYNSDILFANISNSTIISSYVYNSLLQKCKSVNSEVASSVFLDSTWLSDKIVKIQDYEESNIIWYDSNTDVPYKMYKFYLTDTNWLRLSEFQNFYFQDLGINIPSNELLNFFDDKFSIGHYNQTYDIPGAKPERKVLVQLSTKEENRNSPSIISGTATELKPNDISLPSIDIFIHLGEDFDYGTSSTYTRPFIDNTIDISKAYILDSDFVSGLFKNSKWVTGNYFNYNADYSFPSDDGYVVSVTASTGQLAIPIGGKKRIDIIGSTNSVSQIVFLNGLFYDSNRNGGDNLVPLSDTYKVNSISSGTSSRVAYLQDIITQSVINSFSNFNSQKYFVTKNAKNSWNYLHPTKFENSIISSGIFRRAYFQNCYFENFEFDVKDRELSDISNKRKLLLSDVIFSNNKNTIKNGLVQYSHFISGSDLWNGGIFHQGVWNTLGFTYSMSPTSSSIYKMESNGFKNGIFRNSTWDNGVFENGLFYKNTTNIPGNLNVFDQTLDAYYYDNNGNNKTRWSWKNGVFKNGDFEKSNFEYGSFLGGNLYDSNFLTGEANGGNFGKLNIPYVNTRIWTGTFSNVNVINANFKAENPKSDFSIPASIEWINGIFNAGIFGVNMNYTYNSSYPYYSRWKDGIFNGGEFTDIALWENGIFNGGKFTSHYYLFDGETPTPFELFGYTSSQFGWQNGKFNGGEFGTGLTGSNSTWYIGEFNGGKFKGKYWRNGIFTRGQFEGHASNLLTNIGESSVSNYNQFIRSYNDYYYGYWQDGFVSKNKDKFIIGEKIYTDIDRVSTKRKKKPDTLFKNMLWFSGTFSNFDAEMNNSVWLDGTFQDGYFSNSAFNPYINLLDEGIFNLPLRNDVYKVVGSNTYTQSSTLEIGISYKFTIDIKNNNSTDVYIDVVNPSHKVINNSDGAGIYSLSFTASTTSFKLITQGTSIDIKSISLYPGTKGFREDTCVWENGEAYSSDFYYSKWNQGVFDSYSNSTQGNAWGIIWNDGIVKYMNAYNVLWKNGIWKNGNWNGSPFTQTATYSGVIVYPGFASDIINNITTYASQSFSNSLNSLYSNWDKIHMNDSFLGTNSYSDYNNDLYNITIGTISLPTDSDYKKEYSIIGYNLLTENYDWDYYLVSGTSSYTSWISTSTYAINSVVIYNDLIYSNTTGINTSLSPDLDITNWNFNGGGSVYPWNSLNSYTFNDLVLFEGNIYENISGTNGFNSIYGEVLTRFGNGNFLSGIWENGIWNEGWREDLTTIYCDNLSLFDGSLKNKAYKNNIWTWTFDLNVLNVGANSPGLITDFNIGDKVSIGNIVTIDINGNRRLIRDYLNITGINYDNVTNKTSLTLEVNINFPIRSIERDSEFHLIYVTKNVWLNGAFLNGMFKGGVWNNGLFKGHPYITQMTDSQWIDGVFKGGFFRGLTDSYVDDNDTTIPYHTGLIQKFDFYDENVSGQPYQFKYNSWIDVNYYETEGVNINRINNVYKKTSLGFTASFIENNFYGYPTVDVLESNSTFRNGFDLNSRTYRLGWKWKEYTNFLDEVGEFIDINELTYTNFDNTNIGFGIDNFINNGWTFSYLSGDFAPATNSIISNIGSYESEWLYLSGGRRGPRVIPFDDNINFTVDIFDNTNIQIDKLRYSFIEIEAENLSYTQSSNGVVNPIVFYNNYPATYSIAAINTLFAGSDITIPINQITTKTVTKQREYFFNKKDLKMLLFSGPTYSLRFKNVRYVETDMIPFTQIADDCILFKTISTWDTTPLVLNPGVEGGYVGPLVNPGDPGFNVDDPGNPQVGFGYPGVWGQALPVDSISTTSGLDGNLIVIPSQGLPTWDNFYLAGAGEGCLSYINESINAPFIAVAPDIDYGDSNFNYIKSANVTISETNLNISSIAE